MKKLKQATLKGREWAGAGGDGLVDCYSLALEAWGSQAEAPNSGLLAFAYLWRRFGPPKGHWDEYKDLAGYQITTSDPDVVLCLYPSGSALAYKVGYLAARGLHEQQYTPDFHQHSPSEWRTGPEAMRRVNGALLEAMKRLLKPVNIRDTPINLFGEVSP